METRAAAKIYPNADNTVAREPSFIYSSVEDHFRAKIIDLPVQL